MSTKAASTSSQAATNSRRCPSKRRSGGRSIEVAVVALLLVGCGGAPFTMIDGTAADAQAEVADEALLTFHPDASDAGATTEAASTDVGRDEEAATVVSPTPDAGAVDAGSTYDGGVCTSQADNAFGCGPPIMVEKPSHFCVDQWGAASPPAISVATPVACQCVETYNCDCLLAAFRGQPICRFGTFMSCVIGTTGGMVVTCR